MKIHWSNGGKGFLVLVVAVGIFVIVQCATSAEVTHTSYVQPKETVVQFE